MSNIHSLSLFVLLFLLSDSLGAVIQPRLDDHSFNHRRSMLGVRNHLAIEARVQPYSTERRKSRSSMAEEKQPGTGSSSVHSQRNLERSVFYADLSPWAPNEFKTGPSLLVVVDNPENSAAQVLIQVDDPGNNLAYEIPQAAFSGVPDVTFSKKSGELEVFVVRYMPWSFFQDKVAKGKIKKTNMDQVQPKPITKFKEGDIVQILNDKIIDRDNSGDQIRTALCVNNVEKRYEAVYFAVLSSDPGKKFFHSAADFTIFPNTEKQVLVILLARNQQILKIGELSEAQRTKIKTNKIKSQSPTSIRPKKFVRFPETSLFRVPGDTREVNFNGREPFALVLGPPHSGVDGLTLKLPVGVFLYDTKDDWLGAQSAASFSFHGKRLHSTWRMVPGDIELNGITPMEHEDATDMQLKKYLEKANGNADQQPGPHISRPKA